jgi:UDP:flavonoid glycosyltransferase YjiC (YdhE family)
VSAVETVFGDDSFRRRILEVREVARRLDGVRNTVDIVNTLLL